MGKNITMPKEICKKCKYVGTSGGSYYTCDYILRKAQSRAAGAAKLKHKRYLYPECRICRVYEPAKEGDDIINRPRKNDTHDYIEEEKNKKVTLKVSSINKHQSKFEFEDEYDEI